MTVIGKASIQQKSGTGPKPPKTPDQNNSHPQGPPTSKTDADATDRVLRDADVPDPFYSIFLKAQLYVEQYFDNRKEIPRKGMIEISGERYILVRAAAMSKEFFDLVTSLYHDRGEKAARNVTFSLLYDFAHAIGKADARSFFAKMNVKDPIEKLSAGPIHFAHTGWAYVKILPQSNPTPDGNYYLLYDHPFSFEAHNWLAAETITNFPVCTMNAGYSSGWCEESFGIPLVAAEVECRAKGDPQCRFIMAPPDKIKDHIERYSRRSGNRPVDFGSIDIPEFFQRKRLEDMLVNSEETVRTLLNAPNDRSLLIDTHGNLLALNRKAAAAFGKSPDKMVGQNLFHLLPPNLAENRRHMHRRVIETGESCRFEDQRDGRWLDTTIDPVTNAKGKVVRLAVVSRDITDYRRMAEALRKEKEFNATLIETSPAWFVAIAAKGKTLLMNAAMLNALGYTRDEVGGKNYLKTFIPRLERVRLMKLLGQSQPGGIIQIKYGQIITKDGRTLYVEWHGRQIFKPSGKLDFFFALGIDITERKKIEDELQRHRDHLEEIVKERTSELKSAISDLRRRESELERQSRNLEEANIALKVVLKQQEDKRLEDQETVLANVKQSVIPFIDRLKKRGLHQSQKILVEALETNLNKITSPMITKLTSSFLNLTPMEIRIAQLVKEGLANKEIAELLGTSLNTISSHRYQIRSKLGLKNKGANLRSYLLSLEQ